VLDLPLQYEKTLYEGSELQHKPKKKEEIWTLSPPSIPSKLHNPQTQPYPELVFSAKPKHTAQKEPQHLYIQSEQELSQQASGQLAQISGPFERISSAPIILRTQVNNREGGNTISWNTTLSPASCPIQIPGYSCTPPEYYIAHKSTHSTTLDYFSYTQFAYRAPRVPIPIRMQTELLNVKERSIHSTFIHPASIYIGLAVPFWSKQNQKMTVQSKVVQIDGSEGQAQKTQILLIGSSTVQSCYQSPCVFHPDRTGWHQIVATAQDQFGHITQSTTQTFIYGQNQSDSAILLTNPQRTALLIQGAKEDTDLMLGYFAEDEIFLDSHQLSEGFILQNSQNPISTAKALLLGKEKRELVLEEPKTGPKATVVESNSSALFFDDIQIAYLPQLWLNDRSSIQMLLPSGPAIDLKVYSEEGRISFPQSLLHIEKREAPSMLEIPLIASQFGKDNIIFQTSQFRKKLPISIQTSMVQKPQISQGLLSVKEYAAGARLDIPAGHYSLSTDTHSESRLLVQAFPYLHIVPSIQNRMERIQIVSLLWDALFHSGESYAWSLLEQIPKDIDIIQQNWETLQEDELLTWLHTIVIMNQSGIYIPTQHILDVHSKLQTQARAPEREAFYQYLLATAQNLPLKGLIPTPDKEKAQKLFSILPPQDRIWLIPVLEGEKKIRHWTYTQYESLFESDPERLMLALFRIRE